MIGPWSKPGVRVVAPSYHRIHSVTGAMQNGMDRDDEMHFCTPVPFSLSCHTQSMSREMGRGVESLSPLFPDIGQGQQHAKNIIFLGGQGLTDMD